MARIKISHQLKKHLHKSTHHHLLREFLIILILTLLATSGWLPITFLETKDGQALNQVNNWAFTGASTGWTAGNGTGTNTCGDDNSATTYAFATFAYYANDFRAVTGTTVGRDYRGHIRQTFVAPGSGDVKVKGRFKYTTSATSWTSASGWARLDIYDAANSTFIGSLGCVTFSSSLTNQYSAYASDVTLTGGTTYTVRVTMKATRGSLSNVTVRVDEVVVNAAPVGVTASAPADTTNAALDWTASTGGSSSNALHGTTPYKVYRNTASPVTTSNFLANSTTDSYTDSSTSPRVTYYYAVTNYDTGSYESPLSAEVSVKTRPATPGAISFSSVTSNSMRVSWSAPSAGADSYKVERCEGTGCSSYGEIATGVTNTYYDDSGLSSGTVYRYRIRATDSVSGDGAYNTPAEQATTAAAPTATTQTASSINYNAATGNGTVTATGGENPTRYIQWGTTVSYGSSCSAGSGGTGAYSCAISSLSPNTLYHVRAYATNSGGTGYGNDSTFTTLPGTTSLPGTPISNVGATAMRFTWTAPSGGADSYKVERCQGTSCSDFSQIASGVTNTYYDDSSLTGNTIYRYRARATNTTGDGAYSNATSDQLTYPDVPTSITFSDVTTSSMRVNWSAPAGGAASYKVERCQGTGCSDFSQIATGVTNTYYDDSGLSADTVYRYRMKGTNSVGDGSYATAAERLTSGSGGVTSENNIRGNAYNATYGKISFNCLDDGTGGHFPYTFPFPFSTEPCNPNTHGVNLDESNNFAGEAWNATLGLITFNATTTPPDNYAFNTNCPNTCNLANNCWACYNENDQKMYGWARVINGGQWIQFNSSLAPQSSMNNYLSPNPGIFSGYASSSFGSISLNCINDNSCLSDDYKVYRWPIEIRQLSAPNWAFSEACSSGARQAVLKWYVNSGSQSAYQVIINNANNTTSPIYDSGKTSGSAKQFICDGGACSLDYDEHYYFWLRLWDESYTATPTPWRQFNTSAGDVLTDNVAANSSSQNPTLTFTTYKHEFPMPYFSWSPFDVIVGSTTSFTNSSQYYNSTYPNYNPQVCSAGTCYYLWTTTDTGAMIASNTAATTSIVFTKATGTRVYLKTTDADNYFCSTSTLLNVNFLLPTWKEVKATSTGN